LIALFANFLLPTSPLPILFIELVKQFANKFNRSDSQHFANKIS